MSADLWLEEEGYDGEVFHLNVTYNLSPILQDAGWRWDSDTLEGRSAADVGEWAMYTLRNLEAQPEKYRAMNPPNGWGNYDDLVRDWRCFIDAIRKYPETTVRVWL